MKVKSVHFLVIMLIVGLGVGSLGQVNAANTHSTDLESDSDQYLSYAGGTKGSDYDAITVEAWVKPETLPATNDFMVVFSEYSADTKFLLNLWNDGGTQKVRFGGEWTTSGWTHFSVPYSLSTTEWTHLAATWGGSGQPIKIYINGTLASTSGAVNGAFWDESTGLFIGKHGGADTNHFDGQIDDVRIWSAARTSVEIADDMSRELYGNEQYLTGYWKLNNSLDDLTAGGNTLTNNNSATFVSSSPFPSFTENLKVRKSTDESLASFATLQNDDELKLSLGANKEYFVEGVLFASSTSATPDIIIGLFGQTGSTITVGYMNEVNGVLLASGTGSARIQVPSGTPTAIYLRGTIKTDATTGDVQVKWAQATADASAVTVLAGSYLSAEEI